MFWQHKLHAKTVAHHDHLHRSQFLQRHVRFHAGKKNSSNYGFNFYYSWRAIQRPWGRFFEPLSKLMICTWQLKHEKSRNLSRGQFGICSKQIMLYLLTAMGCYQAHWYHFITLLKLVRGIAVLNIWMQELPLPKVIHGPVFVPSLICVWV